MTETIKDGEVGMYADFDSRYLRYDDKFKVERHALKALPVIDVSPFINDGSENERRRVAQSIREACIDIGFFYMVGHGIEQRDLDQVIEWGHRFFGMPAEQKLTVPCGNNPHKQGYMQIGGIDPEANPDKAADVKERYVMSREALPGEPQHAWNSAGHSQWPARSLLPGFEDFMKSYIAQCAGLTQRLARAFALSLHLPERYFDATHTYHFSNLIFNYYPSLSDAQLERNQWSFSPHTDYGSFTLLLQDSTGGLQTRNSAGEWIDVAPVPGSFVVNISDLFARWTNDLYTSNLHRAANVSGRARISLPYFVVPQGDADIRCLETCQGPDNPPRYAPVVAAEYVRALIDQSYRTGRVGVSTNTAARFRNR